MQLLLTVIGILAVLPVATAAIWIGYSALFVSHRVPLPPALSDDRRELTSKAGPLSYYYSGPAAISEPMLLIHSVNAAASAYEVRPLFEHYRKTRTVYALDLRPRHGWIRRQSDPRAPVQ